MDIKYVVIKKGCSFTFFCLKSLSTGAPLEGTEDVQIIKRPRVSSPSTNQTTENNDIISELKELVAQNSFDPSDF